MQEDAAQVEHPGEGERRAGREPPGRRPQLEEVRAEGHPRRQVPKVSARAGAGAAQHNPFSPLTCSWSFFFPID